MRVTILYFAAVREITGVDTEELELPEVGGTVSDVRALLVKRYPALAEHLPALRFARNEVFARLTDPIEDGDVLALIPPVAGG